MQTQITIIGGGILGLSIGWGLVRAGCEVVVVDEGDQAFRASRGNFGLVWVQGKGHGMHQYAKWTRQSAKLWPELARELEETTGVQLEYSQKGGVDFCLSDIEAEERVDMLSGIRAGFDGDYPFEYLDHTQLKKLIPEVGPTVAGATWTEMDGHVNPLYLLRALYAGFIASGGKVINNQTVRHIEKRQSGFAVSAGVTIESEKVVLCAGLGNKTLGPLLGMNVPVEPNRGHIMVCERVAPFMTYPSVQIRQVGEGVVQIGDSKEDVGLNDGTSTNVLAGIARRAIKIYPLLAHLRTVRSWAALRVMSPDGFPIYQQSSTQPGAFVVTCHSGITLAAAHALVLSKWIASDTQPDNLESFSGDRFSI